MFRCLGAAFRYHQYPNGAQVALRLLVPVHRQAVDAPENSGAISECYSQPVAARALSCAAHPFWQDDHKPARPPYRGPPPHVGGSRCGPRRRGASPGRIMACASCPPRDRRLRSGSAALWGCGPGCREGLHGLVQGPGQRYPAVQPSQPEQLADLRLGADHMQAAAVRLGPPGHADQHA